MASPLRSIRARLTVGAVAVVAVTLIIGSIAAVLLLRAALTEGVAQTVRQDLDTVSEQLERGPGRLDTVDGDVLVRVQGPGAPGNGNGGGDDDDDERRDVNDEDAGGLPIIEDGQTRRITVDGEPYLAASDDTDRGVVTVARPLSGVDDSVFATSRLLMIAVPLVLVLMGVVLWVVASRALAPVERLRRQVAAIDATGLDTRVDAGRDDELGALAHTMNGMLDRIEQAQLTQRRFVSDASHELRSPLATIRQHAELAHAHPESSSLDDLSRVTLAEGARMQELVEGMLVLARLDEGRGRSTAPTDLDDLALAEVARLRGLGVDVDARQIGPGRVLGNEALLARALRNLADNAARHATQRVSIRVVEHDGWVFLQVGDDGAGVPAEQRERIFDRFTRLDEARARDAGGSGLGLAIVREVALAHRGTISVAEAPGGGALFTLALPGAPDA